MKWILTAAMMFLLVPAGGGVYVVVVNGKVVQTCVPVGDGILACK